PVVADFEPFFGLNLKRNPIPDLEAKFIAADEIMANYVATLAQQEEHPPVLKFWHFLRDVSRFLADDALDERWNYWLPPFPLGRAYFASPPIPSAKTSAKRSHDLTLESSSDDGINEGTNDQAEEEEDEDNEVSPPKKTRRVLAPSASGPPEISTSSSSVKTPLVKKEPTSKPALPAKPKRGCLLKTPSAHPSPNIPGVPAMSTPWLQACNRCRENGVASSCTPRQNGQACLYCYNEHLGGCDFLILPAKREAARSAALPLAIGSYEHLLSLKTRSQSSADFWVIARSLAQAHQRITSADHEAFMTTLAHTVKADGPGVMERLGVNYSVRELTRYSQQPPPLSAAEYIAPLSPSLASAAQNIAGSPPPIPQVGAFALLPSQPAIATLEEAPPDPSPDYFSDFPDPVIEDPEDELEDAQGAEV
ncbi:hypothetical protein AMATHDRAFT_11321, partial [Amanita thiersii Skay4041]